MGKESVAYSIVFLLYAFHIIHINLCRKRVSFCHLCCEDRLVSQINALHDLDVHSVLFPSLSLTVLKTKTENQSCQLLENNTEHNTFYKT